ncbi:peroxiredoxin [Massilia sp. KIM]|uniref:Ohr family peroxiredoxin n=1 Tax=Massilia sp. KIM TaxID=1955422 RepID=UPI00098FF4CD|nr:Ohr family peroxiredoxin [Massilia sp. KIM]OON62174.1 peroxiredoxin [Massilia sp. KIM]
MQANQKVLYTGKTRTSGSGRDGGSGRSDDGRLEVGLSTAGGKGNGTNPEQLLGVGWAACYISALHFAGKEFGVVLPQGAVVDAEVDLVHGDDGYGLQARLDVHIPGVDLETARKLVERAHQTCPYSKALSKTTQLVTRVL